MSRSSGVVPVRKVGNQYLFLMLRSYDYFDFPKGEIEGNESEFVAAIRETEEETTLKSYELNFKWGYDNYTTELYSKNKKTATYFVAEVKREQISLPVNPELGFPEHHEYLWLTLEEALQISCDRIKKVILWANNKIKEQLCQR